MKIVFVFALNLLLLNSVFSQTKLKFSTVLIQTEQFPQLTKNAMKAATERNLPTSIFIANKVFMQPVIVENNNVLYSVITNLKHPFNGGYLATFNEIERKFDMEQAKISYYLEQNIFHKKVQNKNLNKTDTLLYLIPESTNDRIMAFSAIDGDTVDLNFIPPHITNDTLNIPIEALYHKVRNSIVISDQLLDVVQAFDTNGVFLATFAPRGGRAIDILGNIRGMGFHPNGNLLVSVGDGANEDAIARFDLFGSYIGNFIVPNDSIMDSPFDVLVRSTDVLIPAIHSNAVHRYDLSGNYIDNFTSGIVFPEQVVELSSGEIAVANFFSPNSGIQIFAAGGGNYTQLLTGVTGNRGVAELQNGNLLTTNGSGVYIIDRSTGNLVNTLVSGVSARFISLYAVEQNQNNPLFSVSQSTIDFGTIIKDSTKTDLLIVHNSGTAQLLINSVLSNNSNITVLPDTSRIAVDDSMKFEVTFTAISDSGNENWHIIFDHNALSSPDTVDVMANVITELFRIEDLNPNVFSLSQNYPNPFNPVTYIKFFIPVSENVEIKIFNIKGQKIETLIKKRLKAGEYNIKYEVSDLSSGIYIYTIKAGEYFHSQKMVLLK
jgi:hypothetical protein